MPEQPIFITESAIAEANHRHDQARGNPYDWQQGKLAPAWNEARVFQRKRLTDKQIRKYEEAGYYSEDYREARRRVWATKRGKRLGNFDLVEGRMVYRP